MNDARFRPRSIPHVELGPVTKEEPKAPSRPIDDFLGDLYGPGKPLLPLIEAETTPERSGRAKFPLTMWAWAAGTAVTAIFAVLLILG